MISPVKHPARLVVEDAVEILVAVAVRRGMIHDHVVISKLVGTRHVQPVKHALDARLGQAHAQIVTRESCAKRKRMKCVTGVIAQLRV